LKDEGNLEKGVHLPEEKRRGKGAKKKKKYFRQIRPTKFEDKRLKKRQGEAMCRKGKGGHGAH